MTAPKKFDIAVRAQALTLYSKGVPFSEIEAVTGYRRSGFHQLRQRALDRGWVKGGKIIEDYVTDVPRSGRPPKSTPEVQQEILDIMNRNSTTKGWTSQEIANEFNKNRVGNETISRRTVLRILRARGVKSVK